MRPVRDDARRSAGSLDGNRAYQRALADVFIDDACAEEAWNMAVEFGWDGVIAQLGERARQQVAVETQRH